MLNSGENQLTCLEQVEIILLGKTFTCNALEQVELGSKKKRWSIIIGGKSLNNTGLKKQNKIKKVNWDNWEFNPTFYNDNIEPDTIAPIPEILDKLILDHTSGKISTVKAVGWTTSMLLLSLGCLVLCLVRGRCLCCIPRCLKDW